jgi:hypothetical protein
MNSAVKRGIRPYLQPLSQPLLQPFSQPLLQPLLGAAVIGLILIISLPADYAHGQTLDPTWGKPADPGAAERAVDAAKERLDRLERCNKFPDSPSERCRVTREDDRRPSEKHHERQVIERRWY